MKALLTGAPFKCKDLTSTSHTLIFYLESQQSIPNQALNREGHGGGSLTYTVFMIDCFSTQNYMLLHI